MTEKRQHERTDAPLLLKIDWPGKGIKLALTQNFSDGGSLMANPFGETPPVGTKLTLQLNDLINGKEAPFLSAHVIRASTTEIAVKFN